MPCVRHPSLPLRISGISSSCPVRSADRQPPLPRRSAGAGVLGKYASARRSPVLGFARHACRTWQGYAVERAGAAGEIIGGEAWRVVNTHFGGRRGRGRPAPAALDQRDMARHVSDHAHPHFERPDDQIATAASRGSARSSALGPPGRGRFGEPGGVRRLWARPFFEKESFELDRDLADPASRSKESSVPVVRRGRLASQPRGGGVSRSPIPSARESRSRRRLRSGESPPRRPKALSIGASSHIFRRLAQQIGNKATSPPQYPPAGSLTSLWIGRLFRICS